MPYCRFAIRRRAALVVVLSLALGSALIGAPDRTALATNSSGSVSDLLDAVAQNWINERKQEWNTSSAAASCKNPTFAPVAGTVCLIDVSAECNFGHYDFNFMDTSIRVACGGISNLHNCDGSLHHTWCPAD